MNLFFCLHILTQLLKTWTLQSNSVFSHANDMIDGWNFQPRLQPLG